MERNKVELSVIIVSYQTRDLLAQCLHALREALARAAQRAGLPPEDYAEVWVVDNASGDGTAAYVREAFPWVHLIANPENRGFAAANNQALAQVRGRYFLLLNPDTVVLDDALTRLTTFLDDHPEAGLVGGRLCYADGSFQHSAFRFPTLWMAWFDFFPLHHRLTNSRWNGRYPRAVYEDGPFEIDHPLGACMLVRREVVAQVGGLSEDFFLYCEEIDWCLRIRWAGWRIFCEPRAQVLHHSGASTRQFREWSFVQLHQSRLRLFRKYYPLWYRAGARAIVGLGLLAEVLRAWHGSRRGRISKEDWQARLRACRGVFRAVRSAPL
ncbi:MAG: glycosyltransferase family 2 protein [Chloroflexi bacterium]|nr:glycosyltransferase family 2 protein [Chloroflexota bacterium]